MGKKSNAKYPGVDPQFQKAIKERNGQSVDLSDGPDHMKMSAKLIALAEPFHEGELDYPILYDCAAIAWNECLEEDHGAKTDYSPHNALLNFANYRGMIDLLKKRKRRLFPDDIRAVKKLAVSHGDNGDLSVNVASDIDMELGMKMLMKRLKDLQQTSLR